MLIWLMSPTINNYLQWCDGRCFVDQISNEKKCYRLLDHPVIYPLLNYSVLLNFDRFFLLTAHLCSLELYYWDHGLAYSLLLRTPPEFCGMEKYSFIDMGCEKKYSISKAPNIIDRQWVFHDFFFQLVWHTFCSMSLSAKRSMSNVHNHKGEKKCWIIIWFNCVPNCVSV